MIRWDKNNPLHREIMDAAAHAWIEAESLKLQAEIDETKRSLPWWARLYLRVIGWFHV